jgi:selenoprotein W-related protein
LADELHDAFDAETKLVPGTEGIFDIIADGKLIYSKFETGRFPNPGEIVQKLKQ